MLENKVKYFLKRCGFQELGSVGEDGKVKRGRYLMSSLNDDVVEFFPKLSKNIPNDTALILMSPLYSRIKTYCSYVYHNSRFTGTDAKHPRNEYRIYLNNELENHALYYQMNDIVVMRKNTKDVGEENSYYIDVIKDHYSSDYVKLSHIIDEYPIKGGYGIYDGILEYFEVKVREYEELGSTGITIDKSVTDRINKSTDENKENIFNPATFRDFVLAGYYNSCAITGQKNTEYFGGNIDVVYIKPREKGGDCLPSNGIALCRELSLAFVTGEFSLTDDYEILIRSGSVNELLLEYEGKQIRVPQNKFFQPAKSNLKYHRQYIFGRESTDLEDELI